MRLTGDRHDLYTCPSGHITAVGSLEGLLKVVVHFV